MNRRRFLGLFIGAVSAGAAGTPAAASAAVTPARGVITFDPVGGTTIVLPDGGVIRSRLSPHAVVASKLAVGSVTATKIWPVPVRASDLADNVIPDRKRHLSL